ncbi:MAG TPA: PAS domain S-box protein, partial [Prolixibacteraceae bacterium]|nr:PAS domain S-box protein [Prolixibacteraceae bacterium]
HRWREVHQRSLAGEVLSAEEDLYLRDDGTMDWTRWECRPWYEPEGEIGGIVIYTEITTESKRTLEALKESEEKYRFIFANNPQPMWIYDLETLAFLEVNEAAIIHYGYSSEEFLKMTLHDMWPVEDIPLLTESIEHGFFSQYTGDVWRHLKKSGDIMYVEISSHPVFFKGRKASHILIIDITNRTLAEKQLKLLSKAIEQSPVTVVITDKEGNIEYANPKFTETTGYTLDEVKGKNTRFLKSGAHHREYYEELWNTILAGEKWTGEIQNKKKNGEYYWEKAVISSIVNNTGEIDYFFAVKEDITEKKKLFEELIQAKEKAEESQHNLRLKNEELLERNTFIQTILDHLPIGLALNTINEGKAIYMNKRFQEIYGWTFNEITSIASFFEKVYPDKEYRELIAKTVMDDINSGDPQRMHWEDLYVTRKDGCKRVINAVNIPLVEQNTMVSTVIDITSLHQIQSDLIKAKEKAEESEFRLIEAQKTAHIGHWNWNFKKKQLLWSEEIFNIFGLSKESFDVTAESFESFIHPDDLE